MTDKIEDSLDNISAKRNISPSQKDEKERAYMYALKQKFVGSLAKLQSSETRQIGLLEIRRTIDQNRQAEFVRMYISIMKSLKIEGTSSSTKEHEVLVFSIMAELLKNNLIDPIDKPASTVKTVFRIIQIVHLYFIDNTNTVQQACARVLIDLSRYVLEPSSADPDTIINLIFAPLASILRSGVDRASQSTAAVCMNQLVQFWKKDSANNNAYSTILDKISPEMLSVILKLNCEYHEIFMAIGIFIDLKGVDFFKGKLISFVNKILGVINRIGSAQERETAKNFNSYMSKVHVCGLLEKIGDILRGQPELKQKLADLDVPIALERASRNRVIQVQTAAQRALRVWKGEFIPPARKDRMMSLEDARNSAKKRKTLSKQSKMKLEHQLDYMKEDLNKLVKGGWGPHNRANNYVKKNSGVGGGHNSKMEHSPSPQQQRTKSHKQHIQELRDYIKKSSQEHGGKDKFSFFPDNKPKVSDSKSNGKQMRQQQQQQKKNKEKKTKKNKYEDSVDFQLEEENGDQMVNLEVQSNDLPPNQYAKVNDFHDMRGIIDEKQAAQLLANQEKYKNKQFPNLDKQIMQISQMKEKQEQKMQKDNRYVDKSRSNPPPASSPTPPSLTPPSPTHQIQTKKGKSTNKEELKKFFDEGPSVDDENLSNMSLNMNGILNESDYDVLSRKEDYFQKQNANKFEDSLNFSETGKKNEIPTFKKSHQGNTFTLNPQYNDPSKFNTYMQGKEQEVQEQILDQSRYEQSYPVHNKLEFPVHKQPHADITNLYQQAVSHANNLKHQQSQSHRKSQIFQNMIRNPPRSNLPYRLDKSFSLNQMQSEASQHMQQQQGIETENITQTWEKVLDLVEQNQINEAYSLTFDMQDPIYLLRLMLLTQTPLTKLTPENVSRLWTQFLQIYQHRFIDNIFVQMFSESMKLSNKKALKNALTIQQTNQLLVQLYELSGRTKGKLSFSAANLYNEIDQSIHGHRQ